MNYYSLFQIKKKNHVEKHFYVKFVDEDTGKQKPAVSVEILRKKLGDPQRYTITKKAEAISIIQRAMAKGLDGTTKKKDPLFIDYLLDFWTWDKSFYIKKELRKNPDRIHKDYVSNRRGVVINHIQPLLPKGLKCSQVKRKHLEAMQEWILDNKSVSIWISVKRSLSTPIKELLRSGILIQDPLMFLETYSEPSGSTVGTLTEREMERFLIQMYQSMINGRDIFSKRPLRDQAENVKRLETEKDPEIRNILIRRAYKPEHFTLDPRGFYAAILSACTGLRKGEIISLRTSDLRFANESDQFENQAIIEISKNYAVKQGFKCPKSRKVREVPVPRWLAEDLLKLHRANPYGTDMIFWSDVSKDKPIDPTTVSNWFDFELEWFLGSGTDYLLRMAEGHRIRMDRHIVFHSLRHYFNTCGVSYLGGEKTRLVMGHADKYAMTDRYDNGSDRRLLEIGKTTMGFVPNPHTYLIKEAM